jgi:alcohol dehydrogenase (cytochrome c)
VTALPPPATSAPARPQAAERCPRLALSTAALAAVLLLAGCGSSGAGSDWPLPNADLGGTRAVHAGLDAQNVSGLHVVWRFPLRSRATYSGLVAATPVVAGGRVYVQDLDSNVFALERDTGRPVWRHLFRSESGGPNGVAVAGGRVYGNTATAAFALGETTGKLAWHTRLTTPKQPLTIAPVVAEGVVVTSTTGASRSGRGEVVGLDAKNGRVLWRFDTIAEPWAHPKLANGGGAWQTPTVDGSGHVWVGTANPNPWGGSKAFPNGGMYPGPVRWTDSLLELDLHTGKLLWSEQITPHDVRDYDFQDPPVLADSFVVGAGKAGRVIAWKRSTPARVWSTAVGLHANDTGPLPRHAVSVCPGLLGGVETPLAVADGRVFAPVVDLCFRESALGTSLAGFLTTDYTKGRGGLVALDLKTGRRLWTHRLASPDFGCATVSNDVVFTITYAGAILALRASNGETLWSAIAPAAVNACPAVSGKLLLVAAGAAYTQPRAEHDEVVAYGPS